MTQPYASAPPVRRTGPSPGAAVVLMTALLAGLWLLEAVDQLSGERLDLYGIRAREIDGLGGIATAPFLHAGWDHLISNSLPFWVLGFLVLLGGLARWAISSLISVLGSGLAAWALTPADTIIVGASGLIFGWLTYLLARGLWSRSAAAQPAGSRPRSAASSSAAPRSAVRVRFVRRACAVMVDSTLVNRSGGSAAAGLAGDDWSLTRPTP